MSAERHGPILSVGKATYQGKRSTQEDSFYVSPVLPGRPWFGVISDGMGGHQGGDVASQVGVQAVRETFEQTVGRGRSVAETLKGAVGNAHRAVLRKAESMGQIGNMGATVVAFSVVKNTLFWSSAGDSRLYLLRGGRLNQLTRDFTLGADLEGAVRSGHVSREDVEANPQKSALTSFLGADKFRVDDGSIRLLPGDFAVACTDGVYGTVGEAGIIEACKQGRTAEELSAEKAVDDLFKDFLFPMQNSHQDNSTAVVLKYGSSRGSTFSARDADRGTLTSIFRYGAAAVAAIAFIVLGYLLKHGIDDFSKPLPPVGVDATGKGGTPSPPKPQQPSGTESNPTKAPVATTPIDEKDGERGPSSKKEITPPKEAKGGPAKPRGADPRIIDKPVKPSPAGQDPKPESKTEVEKKADQEKVTRPIENRDPVTGVTPQSDATKENPDSAKNAAKSPATPAPKSPATPAPGVDPLVGENYGD